MQQNDDLPDAFVQEEAETRLANKPSPMMKAYIDKYDQLSPEATKNLGLSHVQKVLGDYKSGVLKQKYPTFGDEDVIKMIQKSEDQMDHKDDTLLSKILDVPFQLTVGGARAAGQSLIDLGTGIGEFVGGQLLADSGVSQEVIKSAKADNKGMQLPEVQQPKSIVGSVAQSVGQFVGPFAVLTRGAKSAGLVGKATSTAGKYAETAAVGAATDFLAFGEHEKRLSDLVESQPILSNPITRYLKSDLNDGLAEGRLKNAVEGLGLGGLTDSLFHGVKYYRDTKVAKAALKDLKDAQTSRDFIVSKKYEDILNEMRDIPTRNKIPVTLKDMEKGASDIPLTVEDLLNGNAYKHIESKKLEPFGIKATMLQEEASALVRDTIPEYRVRLKAGDSEAIPEIWGEIVRLQQLDFVAKDINAKAAGGQGGANSMVYRRHSTAVEQSNAMNKIFAKSDNTDKRKIVNAFMDIMESKGNTENFIKALTMSNQEKIKHVIKSTYIANLLSSPATHFKNVVSTTLNGVLTAPLESAIAASVGSIRRKIGTKLDAEAGEKISRGFFSNIDDSVRHRESLIKFNSQFSSMIDNVKYLGNAIRGQSESAISAKAKGESLSKLQDLINASANSRFDKGVSHEDMQGFGFDAESLGIEKEGVIGTALYHSANLIGAYTKIPGGMLITADDLAKGMYFKAQVDAQAYRVAVNSGLTGEALKSSWNDMYLHSTLKPNASPELINQLNANFATKGEANSTFDATFSADPAIRQIQEDGLKFADEYTFTGELGPIGQGISGIRDFFDKTPYIPAGTIIMPFIKTMANITKFVAVDRSVLAPGLSAQWRADFMAGGARTEMALARVGTGTLMMASGWYLASHFLLTGEGPGNKGQQNLRRAMGVSPRSIRIGDRFQDIGWADPVGSALLIGANLFEYCDSLDDDLDADTEKDLSDYFAGGIIRLASLLTSKSAAMGVSELISSISDQDENGIGRALKTYTAALAVPAMASYIGQTINPSMQASDTLWETIKAKAGFDVRPRLDIFGREITRNPKTDNIFAPISYSKWKEDKTIAEMIKANANIKMPTREIENVRLTPDQYYKMMNHMNEMDVYGIISQMVESPIFQNAPNTYASETDTRGQLIKGAYKTVLGVARAKVVEEDAELKKKILDYKLNAVTKNATPTNDARMLKNLGM